MKAKGSGFYNNAFGKERYQTHYSESIYIDVWLKALEIIIREKPKEILEVGCGSGQFAQLLFESGIKNYIGFDFSPKGLEVARSLSPQRFFLGNAYDKSNYQDVNNLEILGSLEYDLTVCLEVLEHLEKDLEVLENMSGKVILSVPNFDSESHLRFFKRDLDAIDRYGKMFEIKEVYFIDNIYLLYGCR